MLSKLYPTVTTNIITKLTIRAVTDGPTLINCEKASMKKTTEMVRITA